MKPYGLRSKLKINLPDNHPKKGWINWWEVEINTVKNKKSARQKIKNKLKQLFKSH
jgi:hypothetical protein